MPFALSDLRAVVRQTNSGCCLPCAQVAVEQEAWKAAMARARGERVLDDPKLLSR